jgi:ribose transport system substrate-binding protein
VRSRFFLISVLALAFALATAACGGDEGEESASPPAAATTEAAGTTPAAECNQAAQLPEIEVQQASKRWKIWNVLAQQLEPFSRSMRWATDDEAKKLGVDVRTVDAGGYQFASRQLDQLEAAIAARPDAILVWAVDPTGPNRLIKRAKDLGIVVVGYSTPPQSPDLDAVVGHSIPDGAYASARCLFEEMGGSGSVFAVEAGLGSQFNGWIKEGLQRALGEYPEVELVGEQGQPAFDPGEAQDIAETALTRFPDLDAIYTDSAFAGSGVLAAVRAAGKLGEVKLSTNDVTSPDQVEELERGDWSVIATWAPAVEGRAVLRAVVALLEGQELPETEIILQPSVYTDAALLEEDLANELAPEYLE